MYVFIGASISSRSEKDANLIADRIRRVCSTLDDLGHEYDSSVLTDTKIHKGVKEVEFDIPAKYLEGISDALQKSIGGLRVENKPYTLRDEIACHRWSIDLLQKAGACIWDLTVGSSGSGFEIASAINMHKPCLVLFDRDTISTMLNGCTSRLLTVRRWDDNIEKTITEFIHKSEKGLDRVIRFNVNTETADWLQNGAKLHGLKNVSEYLRYLIEKDKEREQKG